MKTSLLSVGTLPLLIVHLISAAPRPEAPVSNYIANFYDPHPIATYGAHPFHINAASAEGGVITSGDVTHVDLNIDPSPPQDESYPHQNEGDDDNHGVGTGSGRRGVRGASLENDSHSGSSEYDHEDSYYRPPGRGSRSYRRRQPQPYGRTNKYQEYPHSEEDSNGHSDAVDSPSRSYASSSKTGGYNPYRSSLDGYSPTQGYAPEGWFNTMQGGYDDYGYNYDRSTSDSPAYKGPPSSKLYRNEYVYGGGGGGPSSTEDAPPSHYAFGAGAPEFVSYAEEDEPKNTFSTLKGRRPSSNGYGQDPYFTFGPPKKKASSKPYHSSPSHDDGDRSKPGAYRPKYHSGSKSTSSRSRPFPPSYYDKDIKDDHQNQGREDDEPEVYEEWDDDDSRRHVLHDDADEQSSNDDKRITSSDKPRSRSRPRSRGHPRTKSQKRHRRHNKRHSTGNAKPKNSPPPHPPARKSSPLDLLRRLRWKKSQH